MADSAWALLACIAWGFSSYSAGNGTQGLAALRLTARSQLVGLLVMLPWLLLSQANPLPRDVVIGVVAGASSGVSLALLYDACCRMQPALASAISAVVAALVAPLHALATGTTPTLLAAAGLVPCVLGVTLVAAAQPRVGQRRAVAPVAEAVLSGAAMSVYYVALSGVSSAAFAVTGSRVVATLMLGGFVAVVVRSRAPDPEPEPAPGPALDLVEVTSLRQRRVPTRLVLTVGISGALGTVAYGHAATATAAALISIIAIVSMSPVVTALLGYWNRGEQLARLQSGGLALCVVGACLAAVATF